MRRTRASFEVAVALALSSWSCTKKTEYYCEQPSDCPSGICNLNDNVCVITVDAASDAAEDAATGVDAGPSACDFVGGRIVFSTDRSGTSEIATILADGAGFHRLTDNAWGDGSPRWSPTGSMIAWLASPTGSAEIFTMKSDGTMQISISNPQSARPAWSPDELRVAFDTHDPPTNLYVANAAGGGLTPLTDVGVGSAGSPSWSPDGSKLVYELEVGTGGDLNVYVMNADGGGVDQLTTATASEGSPSWSPNGAKIAYAKAAAAGGYQLWSMTPTGANQTNLASNIQTSSIAWSADGSKLAYVVQTGSELEVWTMNADGSAKTDASNNAANDRSPRWSPDGAALTFQSDRDGNWEIYTVRPDGTNPVNISNDPGSDTGPDWAPCP